MSQTNDEGAPVRSPRKGRRVGPVSELSVFLKVKPGHDEAIRILEKNSKITVVFTDIQMPGTMDGIALARYVRKRWPPTIIVVSSGKIRPGAGALGDDIAFLAKPYEDQRLSQVMDDVRKRLAAA